MNYQINELDFKGRILDLGSGYNTEYRKFNKLQYKEVISIGLKDDRLRPSIEANLENGIPLENNQYDTILAFNILEHISDTNKLLKECNRVLKEDGIIYISIPFFVRIHNDPLDFNRYTSLKLTILLEDAGFKVTWIDTFTMGVFTTSFSLINSVLPKRLSILGFPFTCLCLLLDNLTNKLLKNSSNKTNYPLGYFIKARKEEK